ncbi:MAG: hypothetical protein IPO38_07995 [Rhodocyclaceae bacterium]|nr:hypothetical protein [Rhodocyclaceae bacterium]
MTIYSKTAKGMREASGKTKNLSNELRTLLKLVNGKATLEELRAQLDDDDQDALEPCIVSLVEEDYIHVVEHVELASSAPPPVAKIPPKAPPAPTAVEEQDGGDLDFFAAPVAATPAPATKPALPNDQEVHAAKRAAAEAEEKARAAAQEKLQQAEQAKLAEQRAAAEAKVRREADEKAKREAEEKAKLAAAERQRADAAAAVAAQKRDAEEAAKRAAQEKIEQAEKAERELQARKRAEADAAAAAAAAATAARLAAEEKVRREAAEIVRHETEEREKREAAERLRLEAGAKAKQAFEEKARRLAEEKAQREAEEQAQREEVERLRLETERLRAEVERQRIENAARAALEAEEKAKLEAAEKARREEAERLAAEVAEAQRIAAVAKAELEAQEKMRRDAEEKAKHEAAERIRVEAEAKAKIEAEAQARREAEENAKRDSEAKLKHEAEAKVRAEAEAVAKREADERAAKAEAEKLRVEAEANALRSAEEKARLAEAEHARVQVQEQAQREAEERAKRDAEEAKWRAEEKERREAEMQLEKEHIRLEHVEVQSRSEIGKPRSRRSGSWGKRIVFAVIFVAIVGLGLIHVMPFNGQKAVFEKLASEQLGQKVTISSLHAALVPQPHWSLEGISVGDGGQVRIESLKAGTTISGLLGSSGAVGSLELDTVTFTDKGLGMLLFGKPSTTAVSISKITAKNVKFNSNQLQIPVVEVNLEMTADGSWKKIVAQSADKRFLTEFEAGAEGMQFKLDAAGFAPPLGLTSEAVGKASQTSLTDFRASGTLTSSQLSLSSFTGGVLEGIVEGKANITWSDELRVSGELEGKRIGASVIAPTLFENGILSTKSTFSMNGADATSLEKSVRLDGNFLIERGELRRVDLGKILQGGGSSGKTPFATLSGRYFYTEGKTLARDVKLGAAILTANGNAELSAEKKLSGKFAVELKSAQVSVRGNLNVSGPLSEPQFSR